MRVDGAASRIGLCGDPDESADDDGEQHPTKRVVLPDQEMLHVGQVPDHHDREHAHPIASNGERSHDRYQLYTPANWSVYEFAVQHCQGQTNHEKMNTAAAAFDFEGTFGDADRIALDVRPASRRPKQVVLRRASSAPAVRGEMRPSRPGEV